ncbi:MAG: TraR/DksA C4-type zinc finger protein [Vicinamibacterales bacterium]
MTHTEAALVGFKDMLLNRRRALQDEVDSHLRIAREQQGNEGRDIVDMCDVGVEEEMSFALLQMRTTTLASVDSALARVASGAYGVCFECGESIPLSRLRALPFAVRCRDCEARREQGLNNARRPYDRDGGGTKLLPEVSNL